METITYSATYNEGGVWLLVVGAVAALAILATCVLVTFWVLRNK